MNAPTKITHVRAAPIVQKSPMAELYGALAAARGEFPEIPKRHKATVKTDRANYSYMYADLSDILAAVTEPLSAHGLGVWQEITKEGVVTTLYHMSGAERAAKPWPIKALKKGSLEDGQSFQGAVQLAKRYSLQAALGICAEETQEGDYSRRVDRPQATIDLAGGKGLQDAWVAGVLDALPENATDREKAEAFAAQLMKDFETPKSPAGVNGAWNKRTKIIDALDQKHNDLFQDVFDAFHNRLNELEGDKE